MLNSKINLLDFNKEQIKKILISIGEKPFRAEQIMKWIYQNYHDDFDKMTNINAQLKNKLKNMLVIKKPKIIKKQHSIDGTIKFIMNIEKQLIETVYIPEKKRSTICISSQVGCCLKCDFCATGKQGFSRNLKVSEIVGQILQVSKMIEKKTCKKPITNVVIMGMGEPLLNFKNVVSAIKIMIDHCGFNLSKKRITLSTSGIVPAIDKLSKILEIKLAISLHASNNETRNKIMPINKKYNISQVLIAAKNYVNKLKSKNIKKFTVEYIMLNTINDSDKNAHELSKILKNMPCKINLIPWNSFTGVNYSSSNKYRIKKFSDILINNGFITTIRKNRGRDIDAACGQLKGLVKKINI